MLSMAMAYFYLAQAMPLAPGRHLILHPGAPQARNVEWLYWLIFWILLAVYVLMIGAFARAGARARVSADRPLPVIEDAEGDRRATWAVGSAVGVTVIILFAVLVLSVITGKRVEGLTSKNPV